MSKRTRSTAIAAATAGLVGVAVIAAAAPASANDGISRCNGNVCVQFDVVSYVDVVGNGYFAGVHTVITRGVFGGISVAFDTQARFASIGRHYNVPEAVLIRSGVPVAYFLNV